MNNILVDGFKGIPRRFRQKQQVFFMIYEEVFSRMKFKLEEYKSSSAERRHGSAPIGTPGWHLVLTPLAWLTLTLRDLVCV